MDKIIRRETLEEMRVLWNSLGGEERKTLTELIAYTHPDFLCSFLRSKEKCQLIKSRLQTQ